MSVYLPTKSRFYQYDFVFRGRRYTGSTSCNDRLQAAAFEQRVRSAIAIEAAATTKSDTGKVRPPKKKPEGHAPTVYFVKASNGLIKIGYTTNLSRRLSGLRCTSPIPISVVASTAGSRDDEKAYHELYREARLHGEWFEPHPAICNEIARLNRRKVLNSRAAPAHLPAQGDE